VLDCRVGRAVNVPSSVQDANFLVDRLNMLVSIAENAVLLHRRRAGSGGGRAAWQASASRGNDARPAPLAALGTADEADLICRLRAGGAFGVVGDVRRRDFERDRPGPAPNSTSRSSTG
jgi:hypothetical protein